MADYSVQPGIETRKENPYIGQSMQEAGTKENPVNPASPAQLTELKIGPQIGKESYTGPAEDPTELIQPYAGSPEVKTHTFGKIVEIFGIDHDGTNCLRKVLERRGARLEDGTYKSDAVDQLIEDVRLGKARVQTNLFEKLSAESLTEEDLHNKLGDGWRKLLDPYGIQLPIDKQTFGYILVAKTPGEKAYNILRGVGYTNRDISRLHREQGVLNRYSSHMKKREGIKIKPEFVSFEQIAAAFSDAGKEPLEWSEIKPTLVKYFLENEPREEDGALLVSGGVNPAELDKLLLGMPMDPKQKDSVFRGLGYTEKRITELRKLYPRDRLQYPLASLLTHTEGSKRRSGTSIDRTRRIRI